MLTQSPLIKNGDLVLGQTGQLVIAPDIVTQATVTVGAYNCMYNASINSQLIPFLEGIPVGGRNNPAIVNIVKSAFQVLITAGLLSNLNIGIVTQGTNYITLKIQAVDQEKNPLSLSWSNI